MIQNQLEFAKVFEPFGGSAGDGRRRTTKTPVDNTLKYFDDAGGNAKQILVQVVREHQAANETERTHLEQVKNFLGGI